MPVFSTGRKFTENIGEKIIADGEVSAYNVFAGEIEVQFWMDFSAGLSAKKLKGFSVSRKGGRDDDHYSFNDFKYFYDFCLVWAFEI